MFFIFNSILAAKEGIFTYNLLFLVTAKYLFGIKDFVKKISPCVDTSKNLSYSVSNSIL